MARFYFHLFDDMVSTDEEGKDLPSAQHAHAEALKEARELAAAEVFQGCLNLGHRIEITDSAGETIGTVWFRDAVAVEGQVEAVGAGGVRNPRKPPD